jgi:UDP-N-acetylmuramoyl-tripeptide--D-alanyl-D-alanine ligase
MPSPTLSAADLLPHFHRCKVVSTDTRSLPKGAMFVALKGPRFDGNQYAAQALETGAACAVVDDPTVILEDDDRYLLVEDGLRALQQLSTLRRREFTVPFFGLTGSNGKTTTKELLHAVLATEKRVHATRGNLNNHIGVPLTLLAMPEDAEIAVVEMGANHPGDIQELAEIAEPTHGLITNVGYAHIENLGSLEGVQRTKGALFDFVREHGEQLFVNAADHRVVAAAQGAPQQLSYGSPEADFWLEIEQNRLDGMRLRVHSRPWDQPLFLETSLSGPHNAHNILAAVVVGHAFGIAPENLQRGIASYRSANNRSQLLRRGPLTIWLDAYNANPSSMRATVEHVFSVDTGRVALILGDMYEVGENSPVIHAELGRFIAQHQPSLTIGVGPQMKHLIEATTGPSQWYPNAAASQRELPQLLQDIDTLVIKGSRAMALEQVLDYLPSESDQPG